MILSDIEICEKYVASVARAIPQRQLVVLLVGDVVCCHLGRFYESKFLGVSDYCC